MSSEVDANELKLIEFRMPNDPNQSSDIAVGLLHQSPTKLANCKTTRFLTVHCWYNNGDHVPLFYYYAPFAPNEPFTLEKRPSIYTPEFLQELKDRTGLSSLYYCNFLGDNYLAMKTAELSAHDDARYERYYFTSRFYALMGMVLARGGGIVPQTYLRSSSVIFYTKTVDGVAHPLTTRAAEILPDPLQLNYTIMELWWLRELQQEILLLPPDRRRVYATSEPFRGAARVSHAISWTSQASRLRLQWFTDNQYTLPDSEDNPVVVECQMERASPVATTSTAAVTTATPTTTNTNTNTATEPSAKRIKISDGDDNDDLPAPSSAAIEKKGELVDAIVDDFPLCLVCHDAPADTIALPCGCCCVCAECSQTLSKHPELPDHTVCVHCRNKITAIDTPMGMIAIAANAIHINSVDSDDD